jgi:hypothetical protein
MRTQNGQQGHSLRMELTGSLLILLVSDYEQSKIYATGSIPAEGS